MHGTEPHCLPVFWKNLLFKANNSSTVLLGNGCPVFEQMPQSERQKNALFCLFSHGVRSTYFSLEIFANVAFVIHINLN